jgi:hypothetical protein
MAPGSAAAVAVGAPKETHKPLEGAARALLERVMHQDVERDGEDRVKIRKNRPPLPLDYLGPFRRLSLRFVSICLK